MTAKYYSRSSILHIVLFSANFALKISSIKMLPQFLSGHLLRLNFINYLSRFIRSLCHQPIIHGYWFKLIQLRRLVLRRIQKWWSWTRSVRLFLLLYKILLTLTGEEGNYGPCICYFLNSNIFLNRSLLWFELSHPS